jgi:hypothetical protein
MKNPFVPNRIDHYQKEVMSLQSAYWEAIQLNKEFQEAKKIYEDLKKTEKELEKAMKLHKGENVSEL